MYFIKPRSFLEENIQNCTRNFPKSLASLCIQWKTFTYDLELYFGEKFEQFCLFVALVLVIGAILVKYVYFESDYEDAEEKINLSIKTDKILLEILKEKRKTHQLKMMQVKEEDKGNVAETHANIGDAVSMTSKRSSRRSLVPKSNKAQVIRTEAIKAKRRPSTDSLLSVRSIFRGPTM